MARTRTHPPSSGPQPQSILGIVCPTAFLRQGLSNLLSNSGFSIADLGPGGAQSLERAHSTDPDIVLVDLPPHDACVLAEALLREIPGTRPVAVHRTAVLENLVSLAESGYIGFVAADSSSDELVRELQAAMREETNCSPRLATALLRSNRKHRTDKPDGKGDHLNGLSRREHQVAALLGRHLTNKEIAAELGIQFGTAKNHVHHVLEKLHVRHRWEVGKI